MKKNYEAQVQDMRKKEAEVAKKKGFASVEDFRKAQAVENRKKSYIIKIKKFKKYIAELQAKLEMMEEYVEKN